MDESARTDVLLRGGSLYGAAGLSDGARGDVAVVGGVITALGGRLAVSADREIDCRDCIVSPGLIDLHSHIYRGATRSGVNVTAAHFRRAVAVVTDAGSAGASTFAGFREFIVDPDPGRVLAFLNVSVIGLSDGRFGELLDPRMFAPREITEVVSQNRDVIRGLKIRLSRAMAGADPQPLLERVARLAEELQVPLMVHIGDTGTSLAQILRCLSPGSIVTHCYTPGENGATDQDGKVLPAVLAAQARGVMFDVGHGTKQWEWDRTERAVQSGLVADTISSDLSTNNQHGPAFDLVTVMAKMAAVGLSLPTVIRAATATPARILGIEGEMPGKLAVGGPANISVLRRGEAPVALPDALGQTRLVKTLDPVGVLWHGQFEPCAPGPHQLAAAGQARPS